MTPALRRTLIAGSIGNTMDWYDFGLYGYFAPVLGDLFFMALPTFSSAVGILLGSAAGVVVSGVLSREELAAWGWRIPFLLGVLVGAVGLYMRRRVPETPEFEQLGQGGEVALSAP